jgi:hypothetical protein
MNPVTSIWRQLVHRRLWPVALLLLAALVAVPVLLARSPEPVITPPVNTAPAATGAKGDDDAIAEPVVAKVSAEDRGRRRRVLGSRKDPFAPAPVKKPKAEKADAKADDTKTESEGGSTSGGGDSTEKLPIETFIYPAGSLEIRFGTGSEEKLPGMVLKKGEPLPDEETPLLVYTGLVDHGNKARFLVDDALDATGDGTCNPHPANCETIDLGAGETEFFDIVDPDTGDIVGTFELDIVKIHRTELRVVKTG